MYKNFNEEDMLMKYLFQREEREIEKGDRTREWVNDKKKLLTFINEADFSIYLEKKSGPGRTSHIKPVKHIFLSSDIMKVKDTIGESAIFNSDAKMTSYLLSKGVDVNQKNSYGETALFGTLTAEKAKILVDAGVDIHHINKDNETPLFNCPNLDKLKYLIDVGVDVNHRNNRGETVMFHSTTTEMVDILVKAGADVNAKNNEGYNALESASVEVATRMIELGADLSAYSFIKSETDKHFYHNRDKAEFIHEQKKLEVLKEKQVIETAIAESQIDLSPSIMRRI